MRRAFAILLATACGVSLRAPEAPGGQVLTAQAGRVALPDLWAERPLVVVFYRGWW
jgi:hypothetical protein